MMFIPMGNRSGLELYAKVDDEDFEEISKFKWARNTGGYAIRTFHFRLSSGGSSSSSIIMHRQIIDAPKHLVVDHINGNKLDNRRSNLRLCTQAENTRNRQGRRDGSHLGVIRVRGGRWRAVIGGGANRTTLGEFKTEAEAVVARLAAERNLGYTIRRD